MHFRLRLECLLASNVAVVELVVSRHFWLEGTQGKREELHGPRPPFVLIVQK